MAAPNVHRVPNLILAVNEWVANGKIDKVQGQSLSTLAYSKNEALLSLADEIGTTPTDELISKALAVSSAAAASAAAASSSSTATPGSPIGGPRNGLRKARPALNIGTVKDANATPEAARQDEVENQADALLKAKRDRKTNRQSLPERGGLPESVTSQVQK